MPSARSRPRTLRPKERSAAVAVLAAIVIGIASCQPAPSEDPAAAGEAGAGPPATSEPFSEPFSEPWELIDVDFDPSDGVRVLVLHDMEGLADQDDWHTFDYGEPEYDHGQELLAADINAVIDGLFAGGATEVHVVDGHGSGNPEPDLRAELLDPRATQVLRDEPFDTYFDLVEPGAYDAVAVVGMHARTGSGGFASHTFTLGIELRINGQPITETELVGLSWGRAGVPVIFASGDDRLAADLETMPWIEFVTVKTATSASTAELRPAGEARADLRDSARRAVENITSAQVMKVNTPVTAAVHAVPPASLGIMDGFPGVDYADNTVTFVADDLGQAYEGMVPIVGVATRAYERVFIERLVGQEGGAELEAQYWGWLTERWLDVESGRWSPPEPGSGTSDRKYHGYR